jgi:hypothetical protein
VDAAEVLEAAEGALDEVTAAITFLMARLQLRRPGMTGTAPASRSERPRDCPRGRHKHFHRIDAIHGSFRGERTSPDRS